MHFISMSLTPEINRSVKFSPYGKPINKSLLTPCRPLGLSRKRKTPSSLMKTPLNSSSLSLNVCMPSPVTPLTQNAPITPLNHNTPVTPLNSNPPNTKKESKESSLGQVNKRSKRDVKETREKTAKKCLEQNFRNTLQEENKTKAQIKLNDIQRKGNSCSPVTISQNSNDMQILQSSPKTRLKKNLKNVKVSLKKISNEDIESFKSSVKIVEEKDSSDEESEEIIKVKKRQAVILSDDEDDGFEGYFSKKEQTDHFIDLNKENQETINKKDNEVEKNNEVDIKKRLYDETSYENVDSDMENQNIHYQDVSCEKKRPAIDLEREKNINDNIESDSSNSNNQSNNKNEKNSKTSNKKTLIANDDEDFVNIKDNRKKLTLIRKESSDRKDKSKEDKKKGKALKSTKSCEQDSKISQQTKKITCIIDDEEDAFTSTPEREKNEKITLIEKIKNLEKEMKEKRKNVEDLKQAEIYKTKHNIDELKNLTDIWRGGCVRGLNELLDKLQMHRPINMLTLINNLNIPSDIVKKSLKLEFIEDKKSQDILKTDFDVKQKENVFKI